MVLRCQNCELNCVCVCVWGGALSKQTEAEQFQAKAWQADTQSNQTVHSAVIFGSLVSFSSA